MKKIAAILLLPFLAACTAKKQAGTTDINTPKPKIIAAPATPAGSSVVNSDIDAFLQRFEVVCLAHESQKTLQFMDNDYKVEQHDKFLKKNTTQFLNNFFSGEQTNGKGYKSLEYSKISKMKKTDLRMDGSNLIVYYEVEADGITINCSWVIITKMSGSEVTYGLYGAVG